MHIYVAVNVTMATVARRSYSNASRILLKLSQQNGITYSKLRQSKLLSCVILRGLCSVTNSNGTLLYSQRQGGQCQQTSPMMRKLSCSYMHTKVGSVAGLSDEENLLSLHFLFIRTCKDWWFEAPQGIEFDTGFVDSMPGAAYSERIPVVLGLPSAIGSHKELVDLLSTFAKLGYRVIIPNLPGTMLCKARTRMDDAIFQFSVEEKSQFIKDFLQELEIPKVDMLVTNGCSVYTGLNLCLHNSQQFKSLSMINPAGIRPTRAMMPNYFTVSVVHVWEEQMHIRPLLLPYIWCGKWFTKNRHLSHKDLVTFSRSAFRISYKTVQMCARDLRSRGMPVFAVYSDKCPELDISATEDLLTLAGLPRSSITALDDQDKVVRESDPSNPNLGLVFNGPVGDIKKSRAPTIRKYMLKFFKTVRPDV